MRHNYCAKSLIRLFLKPDNCVMKIRNKIYFKRALSFKMHSLNLKMMQFAIPSQTSIAEAALEVNSKLHISLKHGQKCHLLPFVYCLAKT